jgi:hypothetical protein
MMIKDSITAQRDAWKQFKTNLWVVDEFLLRNGRVWQPQPLPKRFRRRAPKACFYNARQLVLRSKAMRYCEGYCIGDHIPILVHHAWAVDLLDRVIDPTLNSPQLYEFFGIVFDRELIRPRERCYSGLLCAPNECWRVGFMNDFDPGIKNLWTEHTG